MRLRSCERLGTRFWAPKPPVTIPPLNRAQATRRPVMVHASGVNSPQTRPAARARLCLLNDLSPAEKVPQSCPPLAGPCFRPRPWWERGVPFETPALKRVPASAPPDRRKHPLRTRPADRRGVAQAPPSARRGLGSCPRPGRREKPAGRVPELCNSDNNPDMPTSSMHLEENSSGLTACYLPNVPMKLETAKSVCFRQEIAFWRRICTFPHADG